MLERISKLALTIALMLGILAIILGFVGGSYFHQSTGDSGFRMSIRLGTGDSPLPVILGSLSIASLIVGALFLVAAKQSHHGSKARAFGEVLQKLHRSESDCKIAGVCGGLAEGTPIPSWVWRMLFLILAFCFGVGVLPYIVLWICLPVRQIHAN